MEVGILSMRYAKAIIEYAQEKGLEDRLYPVSYTHLTLPTILRV